MSEMLANQYFISGRYFEALQEYLTLPHEKQNNHLIRQKMIICSTLDENFEKALTLLEEMIIDNFNLFSSKFEISDAECPCREIVNKLENQQAQKFENKDKKKMQIAILNFFSNRDKSLEYFKKLKCSAYADIINPFLQKITKNKL